MNTAASPSSLQDPPSAAEGEDRGMPHLHLRDAGRAPGDPGQGQGLHLRLPVRHGLAAGRHLQQLHREADRRLLRGLQRHHLRIRAGESLGQLGGGVGGA